MTPEQFVLKLFQRKCKVNVNLTDNVVDVISGSMDLFDMVMAVEHKYEIEFSIMEINTIQDVIDQIEEKINDRASQGN